MKRSLIAASALVIAACTTPQTDTQTATPQPPSTPQPASRSTPPTAAPVTMAAMKPRPSLDVLHTLGKERVSAALSPNGLMAMQSSLLNAEQRAHVITFLTAPQPARPQFADADLSTDPTGKNRSAYVEGIAYPARRIRDERDSPEASARPPGPRRNLADGPFDFESWEQRKLHVSIVTRGLNTPRAIEFLPTGEALIAERAGTLRIVRNGKLDPDTHRGHARQSPCSAPPPASWT